jgi:ATP-dependent DNA ligase
MLPGIFDSTIFSGGRCIVNGPKPIRPIHPKTEIAPTRDAIQRILERGWWGQVKIHGHRAQIHIPSDEPEGIVVYNRQGQPHRKVLPQDVASEVLRIFRPQSGWNVIDAEWLKSEDRLFVFDFLKREDQLLDAATYGERYDMLPRVYKSQKILTLPPLKSLDACLSVLADPAPHVEGLIFRSPVTRGFIDSGIVRCRKRVEY